MEGRFVDRAEVPYHARMLAVVWHFWIGVVMFIGAVATMGALVLGYFKDVESSRYPRDRS
jgi:hypothetical protein